MNETIPASSFVTQVAARDDTGENSRLSFLPVNFATVETMRCHEDDRVKTAK